MTTTKSAVNLTRNQSPKTDLTLSAVAEVDRQADRSLAEAAIRDERDPLTSSLLAERDHVSELERRALWGDR